MIYSARPLSEAFLFSNGSSGSTAHASETILFKQPFYPKHGWLTYGSAIILLLILVFIITKKHKPSSNQRQVCQLVEKKYLGNKTVVYILDYQQQRFILADNQHALALHQLVKETPDE